MDLTSIPAVPDLREAPPRALRERLNQEWHERALQVFMVIVLGHWAEHLAQAFQIYVLKWPVPKALGVLGLWQPWLVKSEVLHYGYALVMLIGLWLLRPGFTGRAHTWWTVALWIQLWHHLEHALLLGQVIAGANLFNNPVPTSIVQLWIPRVELHLFYNAIVFIPMLFAMYDHMFPPVKDAAVMRCSCAVRSHSRAAVSS
ncbi:MAG TPA: hypothetical protein VM684_04485 [Gaiellales bacterium]|nr:hypothetical protein [Gaiellales bacterium]